jgi:hypothetical protein
MKMIPIYKKSLIESCCCLYSGLKSDYWSRFGYNISIKTKKRRDISKKISILKPQKLKYETGKIKNSKISK